MKALKDRILRDGRCFPGGILKVDNFINHQMDPILMKSMAVEFVRRFLMHIPPKGFVRIRHYGILSNHNKRKLIPICRNLIGCREFLRKFRKNDKVQAIRILYKKDVTICPHCGGHVSYQVRTDQLMHRKNSA